MTVTIVAPLEATDDEDWGDFVPGDLVEIEGDSWEWELIDYTERPGVWLARANGTEEYAEFPARAMTLLVSADELYEPSDDEEEVTMPSDEEIVAYLDSLTEEERQQLAGPVLPVHWLYPWKPGEPKRALNFFGGCGGWCTGLRKALGYEIDMVCIDLSGDAVATSNAAGCNAVRADVTMLDPWHWALRWTHILIGSPPCTDWTLAGKRLGHLPQNIKLLLDAIVDAGEAAGNVPMTGVPGEPMTYKSGSGNWTAVREALDGMTASTAGLMLEMVIFGLGLRQAGAPLETIALEQSNALPKEVRDALWCEFEVAGWVYNRWIELDAADLGSPSHRRRWFHLVSRNPIHGLVQPGEPITTLANEAIGCSPDLQVVTRGNRRTSGGNAFTMGRQIPGVTSKIRSWDVDGHGGRFTLGEIALLVGMPADHPLVGSRTSAAQQLSDIVYPGAATVVMGTLLGLEWRPALHRYLSELYPSAHPADRLPGLCHPTRPCTHPWPCGTDLRQWLATSAAARIPAQRTLTTTPDQLSLF